MLDDPHAIMGLGDGGARWFYFRRWLPFQVDRLLESNPYSIEETIRRLTSDAFAAE